jgi:hypothetical protein
MMSTLIEMLSKIRIGFLFNFDPVENQFHFEHFSIEVEGVSQVLQNKRSLSLHSILTITLLTIAESEKRIARLGTTSSFYPTTFWMMIANPAPTCNWLKWPHATSHRICLVGELGFFWCVEGGRAPPLINYAFADNNN